MLLICDFQKFNVIVDPCGPPCALVMFPTIGMGAHMVAPFVKCLVECYGRPIGSFLLLTLLMTILILFLTRVFYLLFLSSFCGVERCPTNYCKILLLFPCSGRQPVDTHGDHLCLPWETSFCPTPLSPPTRTFLDLFPSSPDVAVPPSWILCFLHLEPWKCMPLPI